MITTILFDFDGVVADTEPQYDMFFNRIAEEYNFGISNFASLIKGVPLQEIMDKYFGDYPAQEKTNILERTAAFELQMEFPPVPGVMAFIVYLEKHRYKKAIVTSSPAAKMEAAMKKLPLERYFPVVVTADHITKGKPDPMCYLLAASQLQSAPEECLVFEDSLAGITAAKNAGAKVVGVATTLAPDLLKQHVQWVIPDFTNLPEVIALLSRQ
ncbi:MAG: HAD family phosphatase [Prevotellaceae bacterium]|jgi:HAD superfamily hydrolase (TIGR01509 family)|nr:HAD family phosphatase [Prevotellaceae bacterium]